MKEEIIEAFAANIMSSTQSAVTAQRLLIPDQLATEVPWGHSTPDVLPAFLAGAVLGLGLAFVVALIRRIMKPADKAPSTREGKIQTASPAEQNLDGADVGLQDVLQQASFIHMRSCTLWYQAMLRALVQAAHDAGYRFVRGVEGDALPFPADREVMMAISRARLLWVAPYSSEDDLSGRWKNNVLDGYEEIWLKCLLDGLKASGLVLQRYVTAADHSQGEDRRAALTSVSDVVSFHQANITGETNDLVH